MTAGSGSKLLPAAVNDIVGDRHSLLMIGMLAVWVACVVFGAARLIVTLSTGKLTPWWANVAGAVAITALYLWYRRHPQRRSPTAASGTALVATVALLVPVAYGMSSTVWWLGLVGFAMVMLGRRGEAWVWGVTIPVLVAATSVLEPSVQLQGTAGEPPVERDLARVVFVVLLIGMAAAFRGVANRRAKALHASNERYRMLFHRAPVGVFHCDNGLRITDCNDRFADIVGSSQQSLIGVDMPSLIDRRVLNAVRGALQGEQHAYDGPYCGPAGRPERVISLRTVPLNRDDGTVVGALGIVEDVTERQRMEEELRRSRNELEDRVRERTEELRQLNLTLSESEERLELALESTGLGLWDYHLDTGKLTLSERWAAMLGHSLQELEGESEPWRSRVHPDDLPATMQTLERHLKGDTPVYETEHRLRTKSGDWIWVADRGHVVERATEGTAKRIIGTQRDITQRKQSEAALRESEARFQLLARTAPVGIFQTDEHGSTVYVNQRWTEISRLSADQALGTGWIQSVHPEDRERLTVGWEDAIREGRESSADYRFIRPDGTVAWVIGHAVPMTDATGRLAGYVGTITDITERKRAEEALRHAQKMEAVGRLAGGVAHDFNNLLQTMLGQAHILLQKSHEPSIIEEMSRELVQQVNRGASLTRQLLLFSRRETALPQWCDLNEIVRNATQMLRRLVRANIVLASELAPEDLGIKADRGQLEQVLMNLVVNASDAMPEGGVLVIRTAAAGRTQVSLAVRDTGHGIPEAIRDRIFEPFFTTKDPGKGTGLGLSVVHGIVTQAGGRIEVESIAGKGTVFRVLFPRAEAPTPPVVQERPAASSSDAGRGERILIVEDEGGTREGLREIVTSLGYEVVAVASGEEAGSLPAEPSFDLLLTDLMLPGIAGPELAVGLHERWPELRVILMSGYTEDEA
ncbi:MAG: PAS domain S-box protein, partial [Thermoanaerobaculales bacterium]